MFDDLKVCGYTYDDVIWCCVQPVQVEKGPLGYNIRYHLFEGGEAQTEWRAGGHLAQVFPDVVYASKLDLSAEAIAESQAIFDAEDQAKPDPDGPSEGIGMAMLRRLRPGADPEDRRIPLDGLDEAHVIDKLTGAVLTWHAESFGEPMTA